jgi:predicted Zn-ribbon and HTH transcriptional regulator
MFDDLGDLHARYLKGSERPHTVVFEGEHRYVRDHVDVEPLSSEEYYAAVEMAAGKCECGGKLSFDAPARCPKCGSTQIEEGPEIVCYD